MLALGYVIVAIILGFTVVIALGIVFALWGVVSTVRPELMDGVAPDGEGPPAPREGG